MTVDARLLGPVTLAVGGVTTKAGGTNGRALLAALLLAPGQPVGIEQLVLDIWGDEAARNARAQLHSLVSRLRGELRAIDAPFTVTRHARLERYSLDITPTAVDSTRFRAHLAQAGEALTAGRPGQASALLDRALDCWSGPALGGVRTHGRLETERRRLEELRLEATVLRNDAALRDGRAETVLPGLRALVAEFPGDDRFRAQLAEALERSGRAAQAWGLRREQPVGRAVGRVGLVEPAGQVEPAGRASPAMGEPPGPATGGSLGPSMGRVILPSPDEPRISLLGPVQAWLGGNPVSLGSPQQQAVFAILAAQLGQRVSTEELVEGLWADHPPVQAVAALRTYMSRLRAVLEPARGVRLPASRLVSVSDGYTLRLPRRSVDMHVFEDGLAEARSARAAGDHAGAVRAATAALDLWKRGGGPFAGIPGPRIEALRFRLTESWVAGQELRLESQLALGAGAEIIAELTELASEHPLRERLRELLMIALYRAGRQAEALGVYTDTRKLLIDELGVEPGAGLAAVHSRILSADPSLLHPAAAVRLAEPAAAPAAAPPPAQLPSYVADFTGRDEAVQELTLALRRGSGKTAVVTVLSGMGGVGKTTLAVHVAHGLRSDFPDGQLFADLRGMGTSPVDPATLLGDFLYALGVHEVPDSYEQRVALYRSLLADRRMLVLLDDAGDAEQVRPLIPGGAGNAVLVTSRARLTGVAGAHLRDLDVLSPADAVALFTAVVGEERTAAEPEAVLSVVSACGFLPLAVRIAAARLASRPRWSVGDLARRLADQERRLGELQIGSVAVETGIGLGYRQLSTAEARALRLLSVVDTADLPLYAVGALLGVPDDRAEDLAESLVEASMLGTDAPGHYRLHDLVRLYAQRLYEHSGELDEPRAALRRLLDLLLVTVRRAVRDLNPGDELPEPLYDPPASPLALEGGSRGARNWLDSVRPLALAVVDAALTWAPLARPAVDLLVALGDVLAEGGTTRQMRAVLDRAANSARHREDSALLARIRYVQGISHGAAGEFREAETAYRESLALLQTEDAPRLRATLSVLLAVALSTTGRYGEALPLYQQALADRSNTGPAVAEARILSNMARACVRAGRPEEGTGAARRAVEVARSTDSAPALADTVYQLGVVLAETGHAEEAVNALREALELYRSQQNRLWECYSLARLAAALLAVDRAPEAAAAATEALALGEELEAAYCQGLANATLGEALLRLDDPAAGLARLRTAHALFDRLGVPEATAVRALMPHT